MIDKKEPIAHITEDGRTHYLNEHLTETAKQASTFAEAFNSAAWARAAGLLHDLGKAHPDFQAYLCKARGLEASEYDEQSAGTHPNHSGAGGILAYEKFPNIIGKTLAYIIAGHHAGLPDWFGGRDSLPYRLENEQGIADTVRHYANTFIEMLPAKFQTPPFTMQCRNQDAIAYHLWVRMVFSCLVDADFLDTEAFMDNNKHALRPSFPSLLELKSHFDRQMEIMTADASNTVVNRIRAEILSACRTAAVQSPGVFSLAVPTGGGKTLSGTAFALDHAIQHNKDRVIYVIPYTSIIEQTAEVLRKFFGSVNVVEHHSNIAPEREKESPQLALASENWDAPVIRLDCDDRTSAL